MRIILGRHAGVDLTPHQFCNDWIVARGPDNLSVTTRPEGVQLTSDADFAFFRDKDPARCGSFWQEYRLDPTGRFVRIGPPPAQLRRRTTRRP